MRVLGKNEVIIGKIGFFGKSRVKCEQIFFWKSEKKYN